MIYFAYFLIGMAILTAFLSGGKRNPITIILGLTFAVVAGICAGFILGSL